MVQFASILNRSCRTSIDRVGWTSFDNLSLFGAASVNGNDILVEVPIEILYKNYSNAN